MLKTYMMSGNTSASTPSSQSAAIVQPVQRAQRRLRHFLACAILPALIIGGTASSTASAQTAADPQVTIATSMGNITVQLDPQHAPLTTQNFLSYVSKGHYKNTLFHRVINNFMIQGGGYDQNMNLKSAPDKVRNEAQNGLKNVKYSIAMARTADPQSASAQFFINVADNKSLDYPKPDGYGYAVFGKVIAGQDVVDKIKVVSTDSADAPRTPVVISDISVTKP